MQATLDQFSENIKSIRELQVLYDHLTLHLMLSNDLSDLLRAQIVYAVSALDKLIHEFIKIGMIQSFNNQRNKTGKFKTFSVSTTSLLNS